MDSTVSLKKRMQLNRTQKIESDFVKNVIIKLKKKYKRLQIDLSTGNDHVKRNLEHRTD